MATNVGDIYKKLPELSLGEAPVVSNPVEEKQLLNSFKAEQKRLELQAFSPYDPTADLKNNPAKAVNAEQFKNYQVPTSDAMQLAGGAFTMGAMLLVDLPLSVPNTLADIMDATAKVTMSPEQYDEMAGRWAKTKTSLEALDYAGSKVVDKVGEFYGRSNVHAAEQQLREYASTSNGFFDLTAGLIHTATENPAAMAQVGIESLGHMSLLARKGSPFALGFMDLTGQRIEESQQQYQEKFGKRAEGEDYFIMLSAAVTATAVETLEARFLFNKFPAPTGKVSEAVSKIVNKVPGLETALKAPTGAIAEIGQEGFGTFASAVGGQQTFDVLLDPKVQADAYVAGGLGFGGAAATRVATGLPLEAGKTTQAISKGAKKVKDAFTSDVDKRINSAIEEGDPVKFIQASLEKDLNDFKSNTARQEHVEGIVEALKAVDPVNLKAGQAEILNSQVSAVVQEHIKLTDQEANRLTLEEAEATVAKDPENEESVTRIITAIEGGQDVQPTTIASIKGSDLFTSQDKTTKDIIEAYEDHLETEQLLQGSKNIFNVAVDIASGNKQDRFLGIRDQRTTVSNAIKTKDFGKAEKALNQLNTLRARLLEKLAEPNPLEDETKGITDEHSPKFVEQLAKEINALTNAMRLLDLVTRKAFENSPLTAEDVKLPEIQVYKQGKYTGDFKGGVKATRAGRQEEVTSARKPAPTPKTATADDVATRAVEVRKKVIKAKDALAEKAKPFLARFNAIRAAFKDGTVGAIDTIRQLNQLESELPIDSDTTTETAPESKLTKEEQDAITWVNGLINSEQNLPQFTGDSRFKLVLELVKQGKVARIFISDSHSGKKHIYLETTTKLKGFTVHSGGALGSDSLWGDIGETHGATIKHYYDGSQRKTPKGNTPVSEADIAEGMIKAQAAAKVLGRNWTQKRYAQGLLARNWQQVKNADALFAVGSLAPKKVGESPGTATTSKGIFEHRVEGGTAYAVEMALAENLPVYFFDQNANEWLSGTRNTPTGRLEWTKIPTPTLTKNFGGVGSRDINAAGIEAIFDVYEKTISGGPQTVKPAAQTKPPVDNRPSTPIKDYDVDPSTQTADKYEIFKDKDGNPVYANKDQTEAIDKLKAWWPSTGRTEDKIFVVNGRGGTGKTTVIGTAIKELGISSEKVTFALPTHKAKKVIQKAAPEYENFTTIASLLGMYKSRDGDFKFPKEVINKVLEKLEGTDLLVFDEASMVSEEQLVPLMQVLAERPSLKFIFMGDNVQLPPILTDEQLAASGLNVEVSPVFKAGLTNNIKDSDFASVITNNNSAFLEQRMRQEGSSPILPITDVLAEAIEYLYSRLKLQNKYNPSQLTPNIVLSKEDTKTKNGEVIYSDVSEETFDNFIEDYKKDPFNTKWIMFNNVNNAAGAFIKKTLRRKLFPDKTEKELEDTPYFVGENILLGEVTYSLELGQVERNPDLTNGTELTVVEEVSEYTKVRVPDPFDSDHAFGNVSVRILKAKDEFGTVHEIVLMPDSKKELKLHQKNWAIINSQINNRKPKPKYKPERYAADVQKNFTAMPGAAYVVTTHKAQGSTYSTVYVDHRNITASNNVKAVGWLTTLRSLYVATSRPTTKLVMVGEKAKLGQGRTLNQIVDKAPEQPTIAAKEEAPKQPSIASREETPTTIVEEPPLPSDAEIEQQVSIQEEVIQEQTLEEAPTPIPEEPEVIPTEDEDINVEDTVVTPTEVVEQTSLKATDMQAFAEFLSGDYNTVGKDVLSGALNQNISVRGGTELEDIYLDKINEIRNKLSAVQQIMRSTCDG